MKLLAIETAFEPCSVALWCDGDLLERFRAGPRGHAEHLLPDVDALLAEAGLSLAGLEAIGFSRGPGSFTSLRIGIGVVQGLAWGADLPVWPVSSLRTVAQGVVASGTTQAWVAMDARMNEVFTGCFTLSGGVMVAAGEERVCSAEASMPSNPSAWAGVGNGFERFEALAASPVSTMQTDAEARASVLASLVAHEWDPARALPAEQAQPVYLRDRVAEKSGHSPPGRRSGS